MTTTEQLRSVLRELDMIEAEAGLVAMGQALLLRATEQRRAERLVKAAKRIRGHVSTVLSAHHHTDSLLRSIVDATSPADQPLDEYGHGMQSECCSAPQAEACSSKKESEKWSGILPDYAERAG